MMIMKINKQTNKQIMMTFEWIIIHHHEDSLIVFEKNSTHTHTHTHRILPCNMIHHQNNNNNDNKNTIILELWKMIYIFHLYSKKKKNEMKKKFIRKTQQHRLYTISIFNDSLIWYTHTQSNRNHQIIIQQQQKNTETEKSFIYLFFKQKSSSSSW